jgi:hypothetical protein
MKGRKNKGLAWFSKKLSFVEIKSEKAPPRKKKNFPSSALTQYEYTRTLTHQNLPDVFKEAEWQETQHLINNERAP